MRKKWWAVPYLYLLRNKAKLASFVCIFIIGMLWWIFTKDIFSKNAFDKNIWSAPVTNEMESNCYRGGMAKDIKDRLLQKGISQDAVTKLLGKPDWSSNTESQYVLGMCSGMGTPGVRIVGKLPI